MRTWTPLILMAVLAACGLLDSEPKSLRHAYERQGSTPLPPLLGNRVDVALGGPSVGTPLKTDAAEAAPQIDPAELDRYLRRFAREIGEPHVAVFGILKEDGSMYRYAYARLRFGAGETGRRVVTYVVPDTANRVLRIAAAVIPADPAAESRYLDYIHPGKRSDRDRMAKSPGTSASCVWTEIVTVPGGWVQIGDGGGWMYFPPETEWVCVQQDNPCKTLGAACSGGGDGGGGSPYPWPPDDENEEEIPEIELLPEDCAGVSGGFAVEDACGRCVGGTTGRVPASPPNCDKVPCKGDPVRNPRIQSPGASDTEGGRRRVGAAAVRTSSITGQKVPHTGFDIACTLGDRVYSLNGGKVLHTGHQRRSLDHPRCPGCSTGYGRYVDVETMIDGTRVVVRYAHLQDNHFVQPGMIIGPGQIVGYCGNTGNSSTARSHVHLDVSTGCSSGFSFACLADPEDWITTKFDHSGNPTNPNPCNQ